MAAAAAGAPAARPAAAHPPLQRRQQAHIAVSAEVASSITGASELCHAGEESLRVLAVQVRTRHCAICADTDRLTVHDTTSAFLHHAPHKQHTKCGYVKKESGLQRRSGARTSSRPRRGAHDGAGGEEGGGQGRPLHRRLRAAGEQLEQGAHTLQRGSLCLRSLHLQC
jgi:hypothetical protein